MGTYNIHHSILASLDINMKLFFISALLFALVGVSQQALTITGDRSDDCTEEVCRDMHSNSDESWEQCGEACVQMLLELSCELDDECTGIENKEVSLYFLYFKSFFHLCFRKLQAAWKVYLERNQWTDLHIKYVVLRNV